MRRGRDAGALEPIDDAQRIEQVVGAVVVTQRRRAKKYRGGSVKGLGVGALENLAAARVGSRLKDGDHAALGPALGDGAHGLAHGGRMMSEGGDDQYARGLASNLLPALHPTEVRATHRQPTRIHDLVTAE